MARRTHPAAAVAVLLLLLQSFAPGAVTTAPGAGEEISGSHPHIYFTAAELPALQEKIVSDPYRSWFRDVQILAIGTPFPSGPALSHTDMGNAARALRTNAFVYAVIGDQEYGLRARGYLLQACAWPYWQEEERQSHGQLLSYSSGPLHGAIAETYDWIYPLLSEDERATVRQAMMENSLEPLLRYHGSEIEERDFGTNRIALAYGGVGITAIALGGDLPDNPEVGTAAGIVHDTLMHEYFDRFDRDGAWTEGIGYLSFGLSEDSGGSGAIYYAEALRRSTGENLFHHPKFVHVPEFLVSFLPPDRKGESSAFGDEAFAAAFHSAPAAALASRTGDPLAQWYFRNAPLEHPDPIGLILFADSSLPEESPDSLPLSRWFRDAGWVAMRTGWKTSDTLVGFKAGPWNPGNVRPEQNSFFLDALGERLVILPGLPEAGYEADYFSWYGATVGQNTILLDRDSQSQVLFPAAGTSAITRFISTAFYSQVQGSAAGVYKGKLSRFTRDLVFIRHDPPGYLVVYDDLAATRPVEFDFILHGLGPSSIRLRAFGNNTLSITRPMARLYVEMVSPDALRYTLARGEPTFFEGTDQATSYVRVSTIERLRHTRFLAVLCPLGSHEPPPRVTDISGPSQAGVNVGVDGNDDTILFSTTGAGIRWRDLNSDGRMALVSRQGGRVRGVALQEGTYLSAAGQRWISAREEVSAALQYPGDGIGGTIQSAAAGAVIIRSDEPLEVLLNGEPAGAGESSWNRYQKALTLQLPSGDTEILIRYR